MVLFSLSQPGGHPRNWNSVRTICMDVLDKIRVRIDEENARIRKETFASLNRLSNNGYLMGGMPGSNGGGPTMLLPNQLRKGLCMLVWHSYEEDRFGVVQKDLGTVISLMLKLVVSLDKYIHNLKPSRESDQPKEQSASNNSVYYTLETTVCSALSRI
ncbi:unnamed protein product, partial [Anisakis simplex]|uniref:Nucleoporin ndc-1 (inferred by orthology to a C. elegans protein) n=1 Tax=Anisakis simplex TaxID=6269 RepID=A0A0M3KKB3_ANISI